MLKKEWGFIFACLTMLFACRQIKQSAHTDTWAEYRKAYALFQQKNDSAFYYFNQAAAHSHDSIQVASAYCYMGILQLDAGDYYGAQESLSMSLKFINDKDKKNYDLLSRDYNELGISISDLKDYDQAITVYDKALRFTHDKTAIVSILNNKANAYQEKGDYKDALKIYQKIINQSVDKRDYARILTNIAITKWLDNPDYNAAPKLLESLYIRQKDNDLHGQNSSYNHLAQFYIHSHPDSALFYAHQMYKVAKKLKHAIVETQALQLLIKLGPPTEVRNYFERYEYLNDSLQTIRNAAKNQFALIRYEVEKNKADNLRLQQDISEEKYNVIKQSVLLYSVLMIFIGGIVTAVFWYKKRTERLEMEAYNAIRESEIKTSKKVHDVVANGLYRIMVGLEHGEVINRDDLLDQVEEMYDRSRDISYERSAILNDEFHQKITNMLTAFATPNTRVLLVGNNKALWEKVNRIIKDELAHILQELMVNMKKHSQASDVVIKFEEVADKLNIYYTDNGIGLPLNIQYGNGLINTETRIKERQGTINFDKGPEKGLRIRISFPIV